MGAEDDRRQGLTEPEDGRSGDACHRLLVTFDAFDAAHHDLWLRYARTQVGSDDAAKEVVENACRHLLEHWAHALRQESLSGYAWTALKEQIERWLTAHGRRPQLAAATALTTEARAALLAELDDEPAFLETQLALDAALARLPERQYDAVVLRYTLGCPEKNIAEYLGLEAATVRSHLRYAKLRLTRELHAQPAPGGEERLAADG